MFKILKQLFCILVSDSESSSEDESEKSENDAVVESNPEDLDADAESDSSSNENESDNDLLTKNEGWADSVTKILGSSKPKNKKTLVLSRAKKFSEVIKQELKDKPSFEVVGDTVQKKDDNEVKKEDDELPVKKIVCYFKLIYRMMCECGEWSQYLYN